ncbi:sodium-coupled neutral amino acid transporter 9 homolog [Centruroides vittatus]|uniref:sodium-coupled neutral amino acid transporter 9 homolog n=1 Tax=Centruroides vittatus TaxID=120091 RepID=UPI00350F5422
MEDDVRQPLLPHSINSDSCDYDSVGPSDSSCIQNRQQPVNRRPYHYPFNKEGSVCHDSVEAASYQRYKYYNRLADPGVDTLSIPDHVVPLVFFHPLSFILKKKGKQNSIITIFAIWNTMMGTSLLSIPWTIQKAGFACAVALMVVMACLCFYTAYRILNMSKLTDLSDMRLEFSDICRHLMGKWAEWIAVWFSFIILLGGAIVYWVFMSNFLYNTGVYIHGSVHNNTVSQDTHNSSDVYCFQSQPVSSNATDKVNLITSSRNHSETDIFHTYWNLEKTVPLYIAVFLGPVICLKSPTFFTKFNALGTLSVLYLIVFVIVKAVHWGIHFEVHNEKSTDFVPLFQTSFPALSGVLSLAYFIHNAVMSIMSNQEKPENNSRDLGIAYILVACTYLTIGVVFYISFPLEKHCIADNFLNNFVSSDVFAVVTRVFLLFQMITLYPLIVYLLRVQFMHFMFGNIYPSFKHILLLNICIVTVCILFAVFFPRVGTIIRFTGAFAGLAYIFALPCLTYMKAMKLKNLLTPGMIIIHCIIIILGVGNFLGQFIVKT